MPATDSPDTDSLLAATPTLRGQFLHLQATLAHQMNTPSLLLKPLGAALRTHGTQKTLVSAIQRTTHKQLMDAHVDKPIQIAILISQTAENTGAHLQQPNSEAYEADDRCFQVSMARRLMLAHPAAALATNISPTCPDVSAAKRVCTCPIVAHQLHFIVCKSGGGVDQRHSAIARCLADLVTTHTGAMVHIEQTIPGLPREPHPGAQPEGALMDIVSNLHGLTYYIDTAVVTPFSANAGLISAAALAQATWLNVKRRKSSTDTPASTWSHSSSGLPDDPVTTDKSSSNTFSAIRTTPDAWAAIQTTLHNSTSKQQLTTPHVFLHRLFIPFSSSFHILVHSPAPRLKSTCGLTALVVRGLRRRPPTGGPTCTHALFGSLARNETPPVLLRRMHARMVRLDVDFVGGDFSMAVKGLFTDAEFMAPGSSPLWGAGGLEGDNVDCTGFLCKPRRPFHWFVINTGSTRSPTINRASTRRKHTLPSLYAPLGNLPRGWHPSCSTKRRSTSEAALEGNNKERAKAPTTLGPSHNPRGGPDSKYSLSGKAADCLTHVPSPPIRCLPVTRRSMRLRCPVTPKVWPLHGANFGGLDVSPPAPPHWRRHGKMVGS